MVDSRFPVIIGAGQFIHPPGSTEPAPAPVEMMATALRRAAEDSGSGDQALRAADSVRIVTVMGWHHPDPGAVLAERLGISPRQTLRVTSGGNSPQSLLTATAAAIQQGELDVALLAGGHALYALDRSRKAGEHLAWTDPVEGVAPSEVLGVDRPGWSEHEGARNLRLPIEIYPTFENALRAAAGETIDEHQVKVSELASRFSAVAATNPYAWSPQARTPEEIRTVSPANRMVGFPYTKLMNANIRTDQAAGVIVCSVEAARRLGVPEDKWVFPWSGATAHDHWFVSQRADLCSSPAIAAAGRAALGLAGIGIDDVAHVDLYSCFPAAVQMGAAALGLGLDEPDRPLTVTGGLTFAGGPGNNYVSHSIATMVDVLRRDPGSMGLVTALGWYATKHAIGVYSTTPPPAEGFRHADVQDEVDALPSRVAVLDASGPAAVETYTVMHERDGSPSIAMIACLLPDGRRTWANSWDADLLKAMTTEEFIGRACVLEHGGEIDLS